MIKLKQKAFNETLSREIARLKGLVDKITPENVKYYPESVLTQASEMLDIWSDESSINSVKYAKLRALIDFLTLNKMEYKIVSGKVLVDKSTDILVPKGFDGRRSFVKMSCLQANSEGDKKVTNSISDLQQLYMRQQGNTSEQDKDILSITRNSNDITIKLETDASYHMNYNILFWRRI